MSTNNKDPKQESASTSNAPPAETKKDDKSPASIIVDDDDFEEFKATDVEFKVYEENDGEQAWDEHWEDDLAETEFVDEVRRMLSTPQQ